MVRKIGKTIKKSVRQTSRAVGFILIKVPKTSVKAVRKFLKGR